ncbi:two component transcriptional regulator, LuxR family [Paracoccus aminovorans]|uniref:Two component transcriptional regulator, LuxR family n=2 Tax=Paracoccus aminovorans TaxID=34004 RepID=A0A1I3F9Q1_9RHOB|nr:two component transcriptional regulator, LuxR family [Paracoccus aminovorans]
MGQHLPPQGAGSGLDRPMRTVRSTETAIPVILADSNPLVLSAMSEVFERDARFSLLATSATAEGFLTTARRVPARVGIVDWDLPEMGGARLMEQLREQEDAPRIIVYARESSQGHISAMGAGAAGFVSRHGPVEALLDTCVAVAAGRMVFPFLDVRELQRNPLHSLSRRETDMLSALARGMTNREMSKELGISPNTVKFHLSNLYDKLAVKSRAQAIAFFYSQQQGGNARG